MSRITKPGEALPRAHGGPWIRARFRAEPGDFRVDEQLEVPEHPTGAHWWLRIRKTGLNTKDVVRALATLSSARVRQVGYAGLKDRHAITSQWFSLPLEHLDPESIIDRMPDGTELLEWRRARHAVRRGGLKTNRFALRLRDADGDLDGLRAAVDRLAGGVPNFFGEQRFGKRGENLVRARRLFDETLTRVPRFERGLYLSAARSWLFNRVLAERIRQGNWDRLLPGEAVMLHGSRSFFALEEPPEALAERLEDRDIHPSGPLVGMGDSGSHGDCAALEARVLATEPALVAGLEHWRLRAERRALRLVPEDFQLAVEDRDVLLSFALPPGTYATAVLQEIAELDRD
ncbi:MAG: tRNA pseudouridine(13) synthase TruD [Xanthomonadales bacterium]|jgi:tRNA pseudouridine13 synthase|nr:tRNA pseudouridine(13) synthase TruD [Xanthomonadales bacterium]